MTQAFVHLNVHTEFSLVDGIVRIPSLVASAASSGMPAVAITDQGNLFGMVKFYKAALEAGVKPLVGAELRVEDADAPEGHSRCVALCRDSTGYTSLTRLISRSYLEGQQG
ncbi:MAG: PHP domain-containing protein, partial [Ectothiorhodospiraceae bacterium]